MTNRLTFLFFFHFSKVWFFYNISIFYILAFLHLLSTSYSTHASRYFLVQFVTSLPHLLYLHLVPACPPVCLPLTCFPLISLPGPKRKASFGVESLIEPQQDIKVRFREKKTHPLCYDIYLWLKIGDLNRLMGSENSFILRFFFFFLSW